MSGTDQSFMVSGNSRPVATNLDTIAGDPPLWCVTVTSESVATVTLEPPSTIALEAPIVTQSSAPLPSVFRTWPASPSVFGSFSVTSARSVSGGASATVNPPWGTLKLAAVASPVAVRWPEKVAVLAVTASVPELASVSSDAVTLMWWFRALLAFVKTMAREIVSAFGAMTKPTPAFVVSRRP